jgi:hypothetical protein
MRLLWKRIILVLSIFLATLQTTLAYTWGEFVNTSMNIFNNIEEFFSYIYNAAPPLFHALFYLLFIYIAIFRKYVKPKLGAGFAIGMSLLLALGVVAAERMTGVSFFWMFLTFFLIYKILFVLLAFRRANFPIILIGSLAFIIAFVLLLVFAPAWFTNFKQDHPLIMLLAYILFAIFSIISLFGGFRYMLGRGYDNIQWPPPFRETYNDLYGDPGTSSHGSSGQGPSLSGLHRRAERFLSDADQFRAAAEEYASMNSSQRAKVERDMVTSRNSLIKRGTKIRNHRRYERDVPQEVKHRFETTLTAIMGQGGGGQGGGQAAPGRGPARPPGH